MVLDFYFTPLYPFITSIKYLPLTSPSRFLPKLVFLIYVIRKLTPTALWYGRALSKLHKERWTLLKEFVFFTRIWCGRTWKIPYPKGWK